MTSTLYEHLRKNAPTLDELIDDARALANHRDCAHVIVAGEREPLRLREWTPGARGTLIYAVWPRRFYTVPKGTYNNERENGNDRGGAIRGLRGS